MSADDPTGMYRITVDGPARSVEDTELADVAAEIAGALNIPMESVAVDDFAPTGPDACVSLRIYAPRLNCDIAAIESDGVPW